MPSKVVVDTNVWVSYFINDRINYLIKWLLDRDIEVFISDELISEVNEVLHRPKFSHRKSGNDISDFIDLLGEVGSYCKVKPAFKNSPDPDDNFLFDLCLESEAEYLITSDKKLLQFTPGFQLNIIVFSEFRKLFMK
ncbi:MAG TPA: putative toxin-antitoxin system toxin component, PIN family [Chitinophagales bacterium]|nr:putative toxin-antitoxin system toxin component, PIN family [Chitinophagales bacterium]